MPRIVTINNAWYLINTETVGCHNCVAFSDTALCRAFISSTYCVHPCKGPKAVTQHMIELYISLRSILSKHRCNYELRLIHPAVKELLKRNSRPKDWHLLALENPTVAEDGVRVAYTQSEEKRRRNLNTATSVGKYLRRHWPTLADHEIRDIDARFRPGEFAIWNTVEDFVRAAQEGPRSCMCLSKWDEDEHPYNVYHPRFGWAMAVRILNGKIVGRCLLNNNGKTYVRSYKAGNDSDPQSVASVGADPALETWLKGQGYKKVSGWGGCKFAKLDGIEGDFLAPYLDGDDDQVEVYSDYLLITDDGEYTCDNTDGNPTPNECTYCERCNDRVYPDDTFSVWDESFHHVEVWCEYCRDQGAVLATGIRGMQRYVNPDSVDVSCDDDGNAYVDRYLTDNGMVQLEDGTVISENDAVYIDDEDEYVRIEEVGDSTLTYGKYDYYKVGEDYYAAERVAVCDFTEELILKDNAIEMCDGIWVSKEHVVEYFEGCTVDEIVHLVGLEVYHEFFPKEVDPNQLELV